MKQIFHPYWKWEEYKHGMWRIETKEYNVKNLPFAIEFTGNHLLYGKAMDRVVNEWKISCEHNLTDLSINRKAWIGHAACCIEKSFPEYLVREAWGYLTERQQYLANLEAERAIKIFELTHNKNNYAKELF